MTAFFEAGTLGCDRLVVLLGGDSKGPRVKLQSPSASGTIPTCLHDRLRRSSASRIKKPPSPRSICLSKAAQSNSLPTILVNCVQEDPYEDFAEMRGCRRPFAASGPEWECGAYPCRNQDLDRCDVDD
ncbi:hypothetical protein PG999_002830 [Apiospora kogelbergensis]|uniref:Uncharacterized protein n=1 Tax=Apiospora kogelbergensis TaxID=1337665 RepID=A0AAW0R9G3_9PEZI